MRVHLADVGGIPDPFASRIPMRGRSMRNGETGGGGGTGTPPEPEQEKEEDEPEEEPEEEEKEESPDDLKARLTKAEKAATRRENALRKAQAELAALKEKQDGPEKEDPVAKANARLIAASARTVLAAAGITDKSDQKAVIAALNLSDIEVDDEDGPDEDEIEERLSELSRIFGGTKTARPGSRTPRGVKAPERGKGETVDADTARYRRIIGTR